MNRSEIRKSIEEHYTKNFIENFFLFKQGDICFYSEPNIVYVYEGETMIYDGATISPVVCKNDVQVFFNYTLDDYRKINIANEIDRVLGIMLDGKDWKNKYEETFRYRSGKFYQVAPSYLWNGWVNETEIFKNNMMIKIIDQMYFRKPPPIPIPPPPPLPPLPPPPSYTEETEETEENEENILENSTIFVEEMESESKKRN